MMAIRIALLLLASTVLAPGRAEPQVTFGADVAHDRATWHFDNPSNIDTAELVPHFFEQQYTLDNIWFGASAAYRAGVEWRSSFAATPVTQATGEVDRLATRAMEHHIERRLRSVTVLD